MTIFDANVMLKLSKDCVRASRKAIVAAYEAQIEAERRVDEACELLRALNASVAA